ncbi:MAG: IS110 family transposase [Candidatus Omnitrophica bacterium]|nr:IS110 family transposase [Candidatus Omnitrophota bacterium]
MSKVNTRREYFESIKNSIKEAQDYLLIGVDVAKEKCDACFMLSSGRLLNKHFKFENTKEGFDSLREKITQYKEALSPKATVVGVETTGNFMIPLMHYLEEHKIYVVMVASLVTKRNRDTLDLSWNKNDVKDAWNIVDCIKQGKILYFNYPNVPYGDMRRLMTLYSRLSQERGKYKVRLQNNVLCITFPEFHQVFDEVSELVPMTILTRYPLPADIAKISEEKFIIDIVKHTDPTIKKSKLSRIHKLACESIGSKDESESLRYETRFTIQRINEITQVQEDMLKKVQSLTKDCEDYELLQTIPGVGPILAAIMITSIGDINNYRSSKQILKLAGLDLAQLQSGQFNGDIRISRRGKPSLRSAAYQAAMVAARNDSNLRMKYLNLLQKKEVLKGDKRKIIIAIACKILRIAYAIMKTKRPYNDDLHGLNKENNDSLNFSDKMEAVVDETSRVYLR